ncbi:MAG: radical SAM protein [Vulcanimicrobiota bacterium]
MNKILTLKKGIIYGPVNSRRLGASLGINVFPGNHKLCSFDCLYCQYGWTSRHTRERAGEQEYPGVDEIGKALEEALSALPEPPRYLTLSGNGEASLHPAFAEIVERIISIRDKMAPSALTAILSNSSTAADHATRQVLARLDKPIMKLDCAMEGLFLDYNRPCSGVKLEEVIDGLAQLGRMLPIAVQILLTAGSGGNFTDENRDALREKLSSIRPASVQLYSLHRGYPSDEIEPLGEKEISLFCSDLVSAGLNAQVFHA